MRKITILIALLIILMLVSSSSTLAHGIVWEPILQQQSDVEEVYTVPHEDVWQVLVTDKDELIVSSSFSDIKIWDLETGELLRTLKAERDIRGVKFNSDQTKILTSGLAGAIQIWDIQTGEEVFRTLNDFQTFGAKWFQDEDHIITWGVGHIIIWNIVEHTERFIEQCDLNITKDCRVVGNLVWTETKLFGSSSISEEIELWTWDISSGERVSVYYLDAQPIILELNSTQTRLLTWTWNNNIWIWDTNTGDVIKNYIHRIGVNGAAWHEDTDNVISWAYTTARVWDLDKDEAIIEFDFGSDISSSEISPDGKHVASFDTGGNVIIWDLSTGETLQHLENVTYFQGLAWYSNHYVYTTWFPDRVVIWDANTGLSAYKIEQRGDIIRAHWFADDLMLTWTRAGEITLWRLPDKRP